MATPELRLYSILKNKKSSELFIFNIKNKLQKIILIRSVPVETGFILHKFTADKILTAGMIEGF